MINSLRIPIDKPPLEFLTDVINSGDTKRQCVIVPTARSLRQLSYEPFKLADIYTIKDFTKFTTESDKPNIPQELRSLYLKKAALLLSDKERTKLFTKNDSVFLGSFNSFLNISSSLLSFFRELNAEMIDTKSLYKASLYTDYETQIRSLISLWDKYLEIINNAGYADIWDSYKVAKFNPNFIARYDEYIFLIGGYLTKYELEQLKKLSNIKPVTLIFNFVGKKDQQHIEYEKYLGIEIDDNFVTNISNDKCKIFVADSILAQVDMITFMAGYFNQTHNIDYKDMAVIIPDDTIKSYFLRLDKYNLFDVTANEDINRSDFFQTLEVMITILSELAINHDKIKIDTVLTFYYCNLFDKTINKSDIIKLLNDKIRKNKIYISTVELKSLPPFDKLADMFTDKTDRYRLTDIIKKIEEIINLFHGIQTDKELQAYDVFYSQLQRLKIIYSEIDEQFNIEDGCNIIIDNLKDIKLQTPKGAITVSGVLESRMLTYKVVFILELNEGTFPPKSKKDLFLNTQIRQELSLPTFVDRENLLKNYIYQIISKAEHVILSYSKLDDSSTRSRLIDELIFNHHLSEPTKYSPDGLKLFRGEQFYIKKEDHSYLEKNDDIITRLKTLTLSATSINTYLSCSMKFYYNKILKPYTLPEVVDKIQANTLGSAFHNTFKNMAKNNIQIDDKSYAKLFTEFYYATLSEYDIFNESKIAKFIAKDSLKILPDIIKYEIKRKSLGYKTILTEHEINIDFHNCKLKGFIDRVDEHADGYDIIDYKFQDPEKIKMSIPSDKKRADLTKYKDLQLPFYALLLKYNDNISASNLYKVSLRSHLEYIPVFDMQLFDNYEQYLQTILSEITSIDTTFNMTDDSTNCEHCDYASICGR